MAIGCRPACMLCFLIAIGLAICGLSACFDKSERPEHTAASDSTVPDKRQTQTFIGPHHEQTRQYSYYAFERESQWDSLNELKVYGRPAAAFSAHPDYKIFGWHVYAGGSAYRSYNFDLLWAVAYFSYDLDPHSGGYKTIHQWKNSALVDSAHRHGCKVFLTVTNFGEKNNRIFLDKPKAQRQLGDSLTALLRLRGAAGINIDFESVPGSHRQQFADWIISLSKRLKTANPAWQVSLALYAVDYHKVFDIAAIDSHIDFYTLMGYDYYGGFSQVAGPVAPLHSSTMWGEASIESSVNYYLNAGIRAGKLILGLPYYGAEWRVADEKLPSAARRFISHPPYRFVKHKYADSLKMKFRLDEQSASTYLSFKGPAGDERQLWYDDSLSLAIKYEWIKSKGLAGPGIWALGYDHGHEELWNLLGREFGRVVE